VSDVFISYSRKNEDIVMRVVDRLAQDGLSVWVDWQDISISADWLNDIFRGIEEAANILFFYSSQSLISPVCHVELAHARKHNKRIISVICENANIETSLAGFASQPLDRIVYDALGSSEIMRVASENYHKIKRHNWLFMTEEAHFDKQMQLLLHTLRSDQEYLRLHTRFLIRARLWEDKQVKTGYLLSRTEIAEAVDWLKKADARAGEEQVDTAPTPLQRDYINASRRWLRQQRNRMLVGVTMLLLIALGLGIGAAFAFDLIPKPLPRMEGAINIAVADFALLNAHDSEPHPDAQGAHLAEIIGSQIETRLTDGVPLQVAVEAGNLGTISDPSPEIQREAARELALDTNAHVVIYGTIDNTGVATQYQPHFYIVESLTDTEELTGTETFGRPVTIELPIVAEGESTNANAPNAILLYTDEAFQNQMEALTHFMIGLGLVKEGQPEKAFDWLDRALAIDMWDADNDGDEILYYWMGAAVVQMEENLECNVPIPLNPFVVERDAIEYIEVGSAVTPISCGLALFRTARDHNPDYIRATMGLANVYSGAAEYTVAGRRVVRCDLYLTAIDFYNQALVELSLSQTFDNIDLIRFKTLYNIGTTYSRLALSPHCEAGNVAQEAVNALNRADELYPVLTDNPEVFEIAADTSYQLGLMYLIQGDSDEATRRFNRVISIITQEPFPDDWHAIQYAALYQRGRVALRDASNDGASVADAVADFTTVIEAYPANFDDGEIVVQALFDRANAYLLQNNEVAAHADFCTILAFDPSPQVQFEVRNQLSDRACVGDV
jgi:tetratricopeptide (TPR) repeat protein